MFTIKCFRKDRSLMVAYECRTFEALRHENEAPDTASVVITDADGYVEEFSVGTSKDPYNYDRIIAENSKGKTVLNVSYDDQIGAVKGLQ